MKNNFLLILFAIGISFLSCEKEIEIDIDETDQKIVLNAWWQAGNTPVMEVNYSTFIFNKRGSKKVENAVVIVYENGTEIGELTHLKDGFYTTSDLTIKANATYRIEASLEDFEPVSTTEQVPPAFEEHEYEIEFQNNSDYNYDTYRQNVLIKLNDNKEEKNYYLVRVNIVEKFWNESNEDTVSYQYTVYMEPLDTETQSVYGSGLGILYVLSDELFNGGSYQINLGTYDDLRKNEYSQDSTFYSARYSEIEVHKINEALYRYLLSVENNQYPEPFTEPSQIYGNIENGYGIFGTSSFAKFTIEETL